MVHTSTFSDFLGMTEAVSRAVKVIETWRNDITFLEIFHKAEEVTEVLNLEQISLPRRRQTLRYNGNAEGYIPSDTEAYFRQIYYEFLDSLLNVMKTRFDPSNTDLQNYFEMEQMLISAALNDDIIDMYPELNAISLPIQLEMFRHTTGTTSLKEAKLAYQNMSQESRAMFPQVQTLLKLLLVCPVTTCECERSFSALRRLKTWLQNSMDQPRLNHVAVTNVHSTMLDTVDMHELAREFARQSEIRRKIFETFKHFFLYELFQGQMWIVSWF